MLPNKINVTLAISEKATYDKVSSIVKSFKDVGTIKNALDYQELKSFTELADKNQFFIIDLTSEKFQNIKAKAQDIATNYDKNVIFLINEELRSDKNLSSVGENLLDQKFRLIELTSLISDLRSESGSDYFPITINNFYKVTTFPCDAYIKLGVDKYIKVAHEEESIEDGFIQKYKSKRVESLYVKDADFYDKCTELFTDKIANVDLFDTKEEFIRKSQEILHDMVKDLGVTEHIINQVTESLNVVEEELSKPELKKVFDLFNKQKGTFIYDHSYLTLMFCNILCKHMDWESKQVRDKLAMASMFHDLGIENPKKAFYEGAGKQNILSMNKELSDEILDHGKVIAKLLEEDENLPQEVINICLNHHEGLGPDESYPKGNSGVSITQLECVFIVAHAFVLELYKIAFNTKKIQKAYDAVAEKYSSGNFKPVVQAFSVALEEEIKPNM